MASISKTRHMHPFPRTYASVDKMDKVDKGKIYLGDTTVLKQKTNVRSMS